MKAITISLLILSFLTTAFPGEFTAEGMSFELPQGFEETELVSISDEGGPYFPAYFVDEDKGIFVRLRRDVFEDYEPDWSSFLYTDAITYAANSIGKFPEVGTDVDVVNMEQGMIKSIGVENGVVASFLLSEEQTQVQGIVYEILVMLGEENNLYLISFGFEEIPDDRGWIKETSEFVDNFMSSLSIE